MADAHLRDVILLHTNDIHGHPDNLARIATLIERIRAQHPDATVLYLDAGDSEESSNRLSSLTKGVAPHRLLYRAGCSAVVVGNAAVPRYGPQIVLDQAHATSYPHLLANYRCPDGSPIPGTVDSCTLDIPAGRVGVIGLTATIPGYERFFNLQQIPVNTALHHSISVLKQGGVRSILLLSHLGIDEDRRIAQEFQDDLTLIIGGHSHTALERGEWCGKVLLAHAGEYGQHVGRVEMTWDGVQLTPVRAGLLPVDPSIPPSEAILDEISSIETEVEGFLSERLGILPALLDYATDRECGTGNLMADCLRARFGADLGVLVAGGAFSGPLPAGPISRMLLWEVCPSPANPGQVRMTGEQVVEMIKRGLDPALTGEYHHALRGRSRGWMHLSGASFQAGDIMVGREPIQLRKEYLVAGSDFEFEPDWGYVEEAWGLKPVYDVPTILREALEEYLNSNPEFPTQARRIAP